jgi:hypothetical protein
MLSKGEEMEIVRKIFNALAINKSVNNSINILELGYRPTTSVNINNPPKGVCSAVPHRVRLFLYF